MKKGKSQSGFVGVLIVVLALAALGAVGWYAYKNNTFGTRTTLTETPASTDQQLPQSQTTDPVTAEPSASTNVTTSNSTKSTTTPQQATQTVGDNDVKIISPTEGQTFKGGDSVTVKVLVGKNVSLLYTIAGSLTSSPSDDLQHDDTPTPGGGLFTFTYKIPNSFVGSFEIDAISESGEKTPAHDNRKITVTSSATPIELNILLSEAIVDNGIMYISFNPNAPTDANTKLFKINAKFSDGLTRDIPITDTTFSIADHSIGTVAIPHGTFDKYKESNLLQFDPLHEGQTTITVNYKNLKKVITINLHI